MDDVSTGRYGWLNEHLNADHGILSYKLLVREAHQTAQTIAFVCLPELSSKTIVEDTICLVAEIKLEPI